MKGKKVSILLQLVDPHHYEKFCDETVAVRVRVNEPDDGLDFEQSAIYQDRHTEYVGGADYRMS